MRASEVCQISGHKPDEVEEWNKGLRKATRYLALTRGEVSVRNLQAGVSGGWSRTMDEVIGSTNCSFGWKGT